MKRLSILTICSVLLSAAIFFFKKREHNTISSGSGLVLPAEWLTGNKHAVTPAKDSRPADQTFLTFPEWYLVFSPEEQAAYFKKYTATTFPFMSHTAQIWQSYKIVKDQVKDNFPPNEGYHFMIWVIGSSASVEYTVKSWYETVIGRLTDTKAAITAEDKFNAKFTQDYVDFIKEKPWYEFDFKRSLEELWLTSFFDNHFLRKAERKYILTSELLVKTIYGKLIKLGTKTVYEDALPTTIVVLDSLVPGSLEVKIIKKNTDGSALVVLPRYDKFSAEISSLAGKGYRFREIAGNNSAILLTLLVPATKTLTFKNAKVVFTQPISSDLAKKRIAIAVTVDKLSELLNQLTKEHIKIEHVFDY